MIGEKHVTLQLWHITGIWWTDS